MRERNAVTGGQFHPVGVVAFHKAFAQVVPQNPALAAGCLGNQRAHRIFRFDQPGWMELDEFGIADPPTRLDGETERVAVFSSRRDEVRRQMRVWPPAARITASARMT
jgi:hypothetical protein